MSNTPNVYFAPIAERESRFYVEVAKEMRARRPDLNIEFISFYQPSNSVIRAAGFTCHDIYQELRQSDGSKTDNDVSRTYGELKLSRLVFHEQVTFNLTDQEALIRKFKSYLFACSRILDRSVGLKSAVIYQELGGFIAPLSLYFAARAHGCSHVFFEPSFFKGRLYFVKNSLNAPRAADSPADLPQNHAVQEYLETNAKERSAVIPTKDAHHFMDMGLKKLANASNLKKITKKITYKYLHGYKQEYEHILNHSVRSLGMLLNRKICADLYQPLPVDSGARNFIYFPFHVRLDYALTTRSPQYFDQIALVRQVAEILPEGFELYVKEHPASVGSFSRQEILPMLTNKKIRMLHPRTSTYDVLDQARAVLTINSKVGAEAIALGVPVIVLGECFYSNSELVHQVRSLSDVKNLLQSISDGALPHSSKESRIQFFSKIWSQTRPGELYDLAGSNVQTFATEVLADLCTYCDQDSSHTFREASSGRAELPEKS